MKVSELITKLHLEVLNLSDGEKSVNGVYCGDLLSWVMGKLQQGNAWVTIMTNVNVVAVSSLADASCIIISENSEIEKEVIEKARLNDINLLRTKLSSFEICCMLGEALNG